MFVDGGLLTIEEVHARIGDGEVSLLARSDALEEIEEVHARIGDGEATASAVEIAATVTLRCQIATELLLSQPIVVTGDEVQTMGSGETAEAAAQAALDELDRLLVERTDVDMTEAAMLANVAADLRISEMAGSPCHSRAAMKREILEL